MAYRVLSILGLFLVLGCGPSQKLGVGDLVTTLELRENGPVEVVDWMHSPMRPGNFEAITFSCDANYALGIAKVELYIYEYRLLKNKEGFQSQERRNSGIWGKVRSWAFEVPERDTHLDYVHQLGFAAHTRVEYIWRFYADDGSITDRFARFDAGESPWPEDKILLYSASRRDMSDAIDIGFFRDVDYQDSIAKFYRDIEAMISQGFLAPHAFGDNREVWSFYATDREADGKKISEDITNEDLIPAWLKDYSIPGIDAFCLVHQNDYTDRSLLLENFHSLSNNLFSAEAQNWGTAIHECGHAIFHLSDEYGGCACFQSHASSNVFKEAADCMAWNSANGFPTDDCYALQDVYDRTWYSAEEPTFFQSEAECRAHNLKQGIPEDSCRTFINVAGEESFWAFSATCIMHDDGDHLVRPFQRACRRVIDNFYERLDRRKDYDLAFAKTSTENIFGYEQVVILEMSRQDELWSLQVAETTQGVPSSESSASGEVVMRLVNEAGETIGKYELSQPGAVHVHADDGDSFTTPTAGSVRIAVPANVDLTRVVCEFNADQHARGAAAQSRAYLDPFVFEIGAEIKELLGAQ